MRARIQKIFWDCGSEENIVDSGEEFVPADFEVDSRDSNNNIFIFIIGICATSRIKLFFFFLLCLDSSHFAIGTEKCIYMIWGYGLLIWQVHIPSFLKTYYSLLYYS